MSEKKIPAPVYIVIGAGVMLMSVFLKLYFFVFVGAVFIVVGFFKILIKEKKGGEAHRLALRARAEERAANQGHTHARAQHPAHAGAHPSQGHNNQHAASAHPSHQHPVHNPQAHHASSQVQHSQVFRCSSCGVKLHPMFKFCPSCGQKLK